MTPILAKLREHGALSALDVEFARTLSSLSTSVADEVLVAAALASRHTREGHVCVDLDRVAERPATNFDGVALDGYSYPSRASWVRSLAASPLVTQNGSIAPLVLAPPARLYLHRYWEHEQRVAALLRARAMSMTEPSDPVALRNAQARLFGRAPPEPDFQRIAAQIASLQGLSVVSGGPGTGKTFTVVKLLAMLTEQLVLKGRKKPRSLLLAPTGKAAARLVGSVQRTKTLLDWPEVTALIPDVASTLHRALGPIGRTGARFRHDHKHPVLADIIVVDEASMVDVAMMRRLLEAVPPSAKVVLLGDADQLASVEAGAVLADICGDRAPRYSTELAKRVETTFGECLPGNHVGAERPGIGDCIVQLTKTFRFGEESAVGRLTRAVRAGDSAAALHALRTDESVRWIASPNSTHLDERLAELVIAGFRPALRSTEPLEALTRFEQFRVLCAHRRTVSGVEAANIFAEHALAQAGLLDTSAVYYVGRPILVTHNDYQTGLFNGDLGVIWRDTAGSVRAYFLASDGKTRSVSVSRLPTHETAFAMSIHKSQGSEFEDVAILLPEPGSALLSRELLYTAVSRARRRVTLFATEASILEAVEHRVDRATGLRDALQA